jgi:hypothetical protein
MKMFSLGWLSVLLLPLGVALVLLGFWVETPANPGNRTVLQVLGLVVLGISVGLGQRLMNELAKDVS